MKKIFALLLTIVVALGTFAGCNKTTQNGSQDLEIYCINKGYGTDWLESTKTLFQEQEWVKEKYPNLTISVSIDDMDATAHNQLSSGKNYNTTDLFFSAALEEYAGQSKGILANLTESVYNSTVPNENITVGEKMQEGLYQNMIYGPESGETNQFYYFPYVSGFYGIIYNKTLLTKLGKQVPNTTDEFVALCEEVSNLNTADYNAGYAIADNAQDGYWSSLYNIWWAQYSTLTKYSDFYYGMVGSKQSSDVFKDEGRLKALEVFEQIFKPLKAEGDYKYVSNKSTYKYITPTANEAATDYMVVQSAFLQGQGLFHANGDYFSTEMDLYRKGFENAGYKYDFEFMKTPIISSIISKTPSIENDNELSALVKAIDNGDASLSGAGYEVTQNDYNVIKDARGIVQNGSSCAVIPEYSASKDVAIDFLRFMATDVCQEGYIKTCLGLSTAFKYDIEKYDNFDNVSDISKSSFKIINASKISIKGIPSENSFPYGIKQFYKNDLTTTTLERLFSAGQKTAQGIYQEEIDYWTNAQTKWQQIISSNS